MDRFLTRVLFCLAVLLASIGIDTPTLPAQMLHSIVNAQSAATCTITAVSLSANSFVGYSASGTTVGTVSDTTTGTCGSTSWSVTGTDSAKFTISGTSLNTVGVLANGSYSINVVATISGASGSPFSQPETITGMYQGPGDIVSGATAFYSLRAYTAAIATAGTQNIVDLRRGSDNATCTVPIGTAGNGFVDLTTQTPCAGATVTSFCNATSCYISKWYDQSGNGRNVAQATAGNQPQLLLSGGPSSTRPYIAFGRASSQYLSGSDPTLSSPVTFSAVYDRTGSLTSIANIINLSTTGFAFQTPALNNLISVVGGGPSVFSAAAADSAWHAVQGVDNAGSSVLYIDGTSNTGSISSGSSTGLGVGGSVTGGNTLDGRMAEGGFWASAFSSGNQSSMNTNQHNYWGF